MFSLKAKKILFTFLIAVLLVISIKQFYLIKKQRDVIKEENIIKLSYEIIENSNSIFRLQEELNKLKTKNEGFSFNIKDKNKLREEIENKINSYKTINGYSEITDRGIEIKVEGDVITEEMVDLINGIRNTKPRAISLNNKRVLYNSYFIIKDKKLDFDGEEIGFPIVLDIIGDPDVLRRSLDRSGGILDVLRKNSFDKIRFSIENKDNLKLPAYNKNIDLKYSKIVTSN